MEVYATLYAAQRNRSTVSERPTLLGAPHHPCTLPASWPKGETSLRSRPKAKKRAGCMGDVADSTM